MSKRGRTFYKDVDVEVEIDCNDVIEFIEDYASDTELEEISEALGTTLPGSETSVLFKDRGLDGGLVRQEKLELLSAAYHKFSLQELEQKLGTKFDLL
jgi:hypothetical protein